MEQPRKRARKTLALDVRVNGDTDLTLHLENPRSLKLEELRRMIIDSMPSPSYDFSKHELMVSNDHDEDFMDELGDYEKRVNDVIILRSTYSLQRSLKKYYREKERHTHFFFDTIRRMKYLPTVQEYMSEKLVFHPQHIDRCAFRPRVMNYLKTELAKIGIGVYEEPRAGDDIIIRDKPVIFLVKVITWNLSHYLAAAFDPSRCALEVYDPFGKGEAVAHAVEKIRKVLKDAVACRFAKHPKSQNLVIQYVHRPPKYWGGPELEAHVEEAEEHATKDALIVNTLPCRVQEHEKVGYCQIWALYWIYMRYLYGRYDSFETLAEKVCALNGEQRKRAVTLFWKWIIAKSQGSAAHDFFDILQKVLVLEHTPVSKSHFLSRAASFDPEVIASQSSGAADH